MQLRAASRDAGAVDAAGRARLFHARRSRQRPRQARTFAGAGRGRPARRGRDRSAGLRDPTHHRRHRRARARYRRHRRSAAHARGFHQGRVGRLEAGTTGHGRDGRRPAHAEQLQLPGGRGPGLQGPHRSGRSPGLRIVRRHRRQQGAGGRSAGHGSQARLHGDLRTTDRRLRHHRLSLRPADLGQGSVRPVVPQQRRGQPAVPDLLLVPADWPGASPPSTARRSSPWTTPGSATRGTTR